MSARLNKLFFNTYIQADNICCGKFGVQKGGLNEYINKLINSRFALNREETLDHLIKYREIRNRMAHAAGALDSGNEIDRTDVKWLQSFTSDLSHQRDPLSRYLRRARGYLRFRRIIITSVILLLAAIAGFVIFYFLV